MSIISNYEQKEKYLQIIYLVFIINLGNIVVKFFIFSQSVEEIFLNFMLRRKHDKRNRIIYIKTINKIIKITIDKIGNAR